MKIWHLFIFLFVFCLFSCSDSDDFTISEKIILVDSKREMGFDPVHNTERPYLRVKFDKEAADWTTIYGISGFDYEDGYSYELKIQEKVLKNPLQDQNKINYILKEIISKTKALE
jgi:hypothetical protein